MEYDFKGKSTMIVKKLKKSWTVAAANARLKSSFLVTKVSETRVLVMVVPILAPIIIGMVYPMGRMPPRPAPL